MCRVNVFLFFNGNIVLFTLINYRFNNSNRNDHKINILKAHNNKSVYTVHIKYCLTFLYNKVTTVT